MLRTLSAAVALGLLLCAAVHTEALPTAPSAGIAEFFRALTGEWIGVCKHSTDGQNCENDYIHAVVKETTPGNYTAHFDYYRADDSGNLQQIGGSDITATISSATGASTKVVGNGEIWVDRKSRRQEHDLTETLVCTGCGTVNGRGSGSLKVSGMPLGLGKLGRVRDDQSTWTISGNTLTVHQSMSIQFKALFISKNFKVDADYTAVRGTDVTSLLPKKSTPAEKTGG